MIETKRAKQDIVTHPKYKGSRIYQPYRAIGHVTENVPFALQMRGTEYFIIVSVGRAFQIYNASRLHLKFVSQQTSDTISSICAVGDFVFAACGSDIVKFERAKIVATLPSKAGVSLMISLGDHLISCHEDKVIRVWDVDSCEIYTEIDLAGAITVSAMMHPSTYVNKILLGSTEGKLELWNVKTNKKIFEYRGFGSAVSVIEQSPVIDVVAVGLLDGRVILHNLKSDSTLMKFQQEGRVTSISFRTDEISFMATANGSGDIALWDLEEKRLFHLLTAAHDGSIPSIHFFRGQPLLLTSGADNTVCQWTFENLKGLPRLIRSRSGHHAPPTSIRFYDEDGRYILSAGRDMSMRLFCTIRDEQNVELSQGSLKKKAKQINKSVDLLRLPCVSAFSSSMVRERDWDNVVTCHLNAPYAKTWSYDKKAIGKHTLTTPDGSNVKSVAMSCCGNFAFLGSASGRVDMFNVQSGFHRKYFGSDGNGHKKAVTGVASDHLNRTVVSGSLDGTLKFWDFKSCSCLATLDLKSAIVQIVLKGENALLAVACDDLCVRVIDIDTMKTVREFWGHDGRITDMCFSPDGRWLVSSSFDSTIRTWDIPSGYLVDAFVVSQIATSIAFSPTADFLVSAHSNSVGLHMWANKLKFSNTVLRRLPDDFDISAIALPAISGDNVEIQTSDEDQFEEIKTYYSSPDQLHEGMVTLSLEPHSKWHNLVNLETIKKRNKPAEPPKAPENAPFFLPTLPGLEPKFVVEVKNDDDDSKTLSKLLKMNSFNAETDFTKRLRDATDFGNYTSFGAFLKTMPPSSLDFEIRSLSLEDDFKAVRDLIAAVNALMKSNRDFEVLQAIFNVVLKIHGDIIVENPDLFREQLETATKQYESHWARIDELFQKSLCVMDFSRL